MSRELCDRISLGRCCSRAKNVRSKASKYLSVRHQASSIICDSPSAALYPGPCSLRTPTSIEASLGVSSTRGHLRALKLSRHTHLIDLSNWCWRLPGHVSERAAVRSLGTMCSAGNGERRVVRKPADWRAHPRLSQITPRD